MRHQERIYIQNDNSAIKNRHILNVNMSSSLCVFQPPKFGVSGATKVQYGTTLTTFDTTNFNIYGASAYTECFGTYDAGCYTQSNWNLNIFENGNSVYNEIFNTETVYTGFPSDNVFVTSLCDGFATLGYGYSNTGTTFNINKPYGVKEIKVDVSIEVVTCSANCTSDLFITGTANFPYINSTTNGVYIVDGNMNTTATLPFVFNFTANTNTFTATSAVFKYNVYKYNNDMGVFVIPPVYTSNQYEYSDLTNEKLLVDLPLNELNLDGDYLIKGYFEGNTGTEFLSRLGKKINTSDYASGLQYQLYNKNLDYYFVAISKADNPLFSISQISGETQSTRFPLYQQIFLIDEGVANANTNGFTRTGSTLTLQSTYTGDLLLTLNGVTLAKNLDYTLDGQILTFTIPIYIGDIITVIYTSNSNAKLISDTIIIDTSIVSGQTGSQGTNKYYYNTTTSKYEIYTQQKPIPSSNIIVTLNGVTLANNIDYYQSTSNPNRIILIGSIIVGDIILIVYYPQANVINGISQSENFINWYVPNQQKLDNGSFELQYSSGATFTGYVVSDVVQYQPYVTSYRGMLTLSGDVGTKWYYRVMNKKEYRSICGDIIESIAYSDTVPVIIQSNAINSY